MNVLDYKKIDISKIIYKEPIKKGNHLYSNIYYKYNNEEIPLYIQTPKLKLATDLKINNTKSFIELELDKEHINFFEFINNIDDNNILTTYNNSDIWFQNQLPMDIIDDFYIGQIRMKEYNKSPIIKFKIPIYKNKKGCDFFGENKIPINPELINKQSSVICILELNGIKFFKQRFECDWNVIQLRAYLLNNIKLTECLINEDYLSDNEQDTSLYSTTKNISIDLNTPNQFNNIDTNNNSLENNESLENEIIENEIIENNKSMENEIIENNESMENEIIEKNEIMDNNSDDLLTEDELENEICKGLEEKLEEIEIQDEKNIVEKNEKLISEIEELKKKNIKLNKIKNKYEILN